MRSLAFRLFLLFALVVGSKLALANEYEIELFKVDIDLAKNGSMQVHETIRAKFLVQRRGIFRKIPIQYDTGKGVGRKLFLTDIQVTDLNGAEYTTKISQEGADRVIRIGDEDIFLPPGTVKTYVIKYRADGMINWFDESKDWTPSAELYWGLTGEGWDTQINRVEFNVKFPKVEGAEGVRARVFYGPYGSRLEHTLLKPEVGSFDVETGTVLSLTDSSVFGGRKEPTPAYSGLTLVLTVPASTIDKPTFLVAAYRFLLPNLGFTIPIFLFIGMFFFWIFKGRDPRPGPIVTQFDPPDGLGGPELGAFLDQSVDKRDMVAGIISLAVKGYLKLEPKEEGLVFKKRTADLVLTGKAASGDLTPFEDKLLGKLQACGSPIDESELRRNVAPHVAELQTILYDELVKKGFYHISPEKARTSWGCGGCGVGIGLGVLFFILNPFQNPLPSIIGVIVGGILVSIIASYMPRRTHEGVKAWSRAKGFEEFVRRAKSHEIEWMTQKHPDQALFESYLPHAVAMGLAREWAQAFEGIVDQMPDWYGGPRGTTFHPVYFANDLTSISDSVGAAAAVPPRSSGGSGGSSGFSSGGGFSGGGFGGGGGGSW